MKIFGLGRAAAVSFVLIAGLAAAAPTGLPVLKAVARIELGLWQIKTVGSDAAPRALCVSDAAVLVQYGHGNAQCQRSIVTNDYNVATVHYVCPGAGHGQTSIKVATPHAFNLETQGILGGAPFDEAYEARRIGACGAETQAH